MSVVWCRLAVRERLRRLKLLLWYDFMLLGSAHYHPHERSEADPMRSPGSISVAPANGLNWRLGETYKSEMGAVSDCMSRRYLPAKARELFAQTILTLRSRFVFEREQIKNTCSRTVDVAVCERVLAEDTVVGRV